jgi:uncharacterized membrane protein
VAPVVAPLVLVWLVLTLVLGVVLGAIVLVQFTLSRIRPRQEAAQQASSAPDQAARHAQAQAA